MPIVNQFPAITRSEMDFLINHLRMESQYLEFLLDRSERLRDYLNTDTQNRTKNHDDTPQSVAEFEKLNSTDSDLIKLLATLPADRQTMKTLLNRCKDSNGTVPTLRFLINNLPEPVRSELKSIRSELNRKIQQIRTVNSGSQTILVYTLNYYEKLLSGLSGDSNPGCCYSASGNLSSHSTSILRTDC